jgi:hypothetical protein
MQNKLPKQYQEKIIPAHVAKKDREKLLMKESSNKKIPTKSGR